MRQWLALYIKAMQLGNLKDMDKYKKKLQEFEGSRAMFLKLITDDDDMECNEAHQDILADENDSMFEAIFNDRI